jgi:hypothetical protein
MQILGFATDMNDEAHTTVCDVHVARKIFCVFEFFARFLPTRKLDKGRLIICTATVYNAWLDRFTTYSIKKRCTDLINPRMYPIYLNRLANIVL